MTENTISVPCRQCENVQPHAVRGDYRKQRHYADNDPADWMETAWFILECQICNDVQFATRWFGSVEQPPVYQDEPDPPVSYGWTFYSPSDSWQQFGDDFDQYGLDGT